MSTLCKGSRRRSAKPLYVYKYLRDIKKPAEALPQQTFENTCYIEKKIQTVPTTVTAAMKKWNTIVSVCIVPSPSVMCINITNCNAACATAIIRMLVKIVANGKLVYNATYKARNVNASDKTNPKTCDHGNPL